MAADLRVLVAGAGIGGLSAALALKRAGVPVRVLERAPEPPPAETGLQIWFNGVVAAEQLGVANRLREVGTELEGQLFVSARGDTLAETPFGPVAERLGLPRPVSVGRRELLSVLLESLGEDVRYGAACAAWTQDGEQVVVRMEDGSEEAASVLVIADGLNSSLRAGLVHAAPVSAGYQYMRAVTEADPGETLRPSWLHVAFGRGTRLGTVAIGSRWVVFGSFPAAPGTADPPEGRKADFAARLAGFAAPFPGLLAAIPGDGAVARTDIADIDPLERWSEGRVVLTGDAAHATTPNMGRGASEALEDGVRLADRLTGVDLEKAGEVAGALRAFEDERRGPTKAVQVGSRRSGKLIASTNPVLWRFRDHVGMRLLPGRIIRGVEREFG